MHRKNGNRFPPKFKPHCFSKVLKLKSLYYHDCMLKNMASPCDVLPHVYIFQCGHFNQERQVNEVKIIVYCTDDIDNQFCQKSLVLRLYRSKINAPMESRHWWWWLMTSTKTDKADEVDEVMK